MTNTNINYSEIIANNIIKIASFCDIVKENKTIKIIVNDYIKKGFTLYKNPNYTRIEKKLINNFLNTIEKYSTKEVYTSTFFYQFGEYVICVTFKSLKR